MSSKTRFDIHLMQEEDRLGALNLLKNSFFHDEPLARYLELGEPIDFAENLINDSINEQCSFVIYDIETNQLIGLCLNEIKFKDMKYFISENNEKLYFILHLLDHMHEKINLFDEFQTNILLHIFIINIQSEYRGYGLSSRLISSSLEHAKQFHAGGAYAEATNIYSFNAFKQLNFQVYHQLNYAQYDQIRLANLTDKTHDQCQLVARSI